MIISAKFGATTLRNVVTSRVGDDIKVVFGGKSTATDGNRIFVADLPDSEDENVRLLAETSAYHEAEHVAVLQEIRALPGIFRGSRNVKDMIDAGVRHHQIQQNHVAIFKSMWNVYEDIRIDCRANNKWPGTTELYQKSDEILIRNHIKKNFAKMDPITKLGMMAIAQVRDNFYEKLGYNRSNFPFSAQDVQMYQATLGTLEARANNMSTAEDSMALAKEALNIVLKAFGPPPPPPPPPPQQPPQKGDQSQDSDGDGEGEGESQGGGKPQKKDKKDKPEPKDKSDKKDKAKPEKKDKGEESGESDESEGEPDESDGSEGDGESEGSDEKDSKDSKGSGGKDKPEPKDKPESKDKGKGKGKDEADEGEEEPEDGEGQGKGSKDEGEEEGEPEDGEGEGAGGEGEPEEDEGEGEGEGEPDEGEDSEAQPSPQAPNQTKTPDEKQGASDKGTPQPSKEEADGEPAGSEGGEEEEEGEPQESRGADVAPFHRRHDENVLLEHQSVLDLNQNKMQLINTTAHDFYSVHPDVKDSYHLNQVRGNYDWLSTGKQWFGGTEAKIRTILLAEKAPKILDGLTRGKRLDSKHLYRFRDQEFGKVPALWTTRLQGQKIDTAVYISMDGSSSMRGYAWHTQCAVIAGLASIMDTCNVKYRLVEWTTGNGNTPYQENKCQRNFPIQRRAFNEWDTRLNVRDLPADPLGGGTPTVDDILYGMRELASRREVRKIFIMLTDGEPGYSYDLMDAAMSYGEGILEKARQAGVKVFGFGIGMDEHNQVMRKLFKKSWVALDSGKPAEQAIKIMAKIQEALL
jgi:hypothetical protein